MCRPNHRPAGAERRRSPLLLLTHDSFVFDDLPAKDDEAKRLKKNPFLHGLGGPSIAATLATVSFYVAALFVLEHLTRLLIQQYAHVDPILESARNRGVLARHVAVDFVALSFCAYVAITNRRSCQAILTHGMNYGKCDSMREEDFAERIFAYHPGAQRLMTLFFVYQVKNMYDTIYWGDGIAFVLHHIFAGAAAWGGMFPGCCHFYSFFYFGFSEVSTAILSLLANFDPEFGVDGLDRVFPVTKFALGGLFVASFVVCRLIMWPFFSYHFAKDSMRAIKSDLPLAEGRRGYLWVIMTCCAGLSLIQLVFVGMIIENGKAEYAKFMNPEL